MTIRITEQSRTTHSALIRALVKEYESHAYYVQADHIGHPHGKPPAIGGHIPDIAVYSQGTLTIIAEAESCDTIRDSDTRDQWTAFSGSIYRFEVIVPKTCLEEAKSQSRIWGISVDKWWWL